MDIIFLHLNRKENKIWIASRSLYPSNVATIESLFFLRAIRIVYEATQLRHVLAEVLAFIFLNR